LFEAVHPFPRGLPHILGQTSFSPVNGVILMSMGYEKDGFAFLTDGFEPLKFFA
jgi:hypothetical protein